MKLYGSGKYALSAVKEIRVTEQLEDVLTHCRTKESRSECQTRVALQHITDSCHCLPFTLKNYSEPGVPVCNREGRHCAEQVW